jgi:hypothetical protein
MKMLMRFIRREERKLVLEDEMEEGRKEYLFGRKKIYSLECVG